MKYIAIKNENLDAMFDKVSTASREFAKAASVKVSDEKKETLNSAKKKYQAAINTAAIAYWIDSAEHGDGMKNMLADAQRPEIKGTKTLSLLDSPIKGYRFIKEFISCELTAEQAKKREACEPSTDWEQLVEIARKYCVGFVSMTELSEEKAKDYVSDFENTWKSKRSDVTACKMEEGEKTFSKRGCKRVLQDMFNAIVVNHDGMALKTEHVESVLAKISKAEGAVSAYVDTPEKFLEACLPALRAYVTGEGIKQRINKLSKEEKKAKEQELPVTEKPSKNNKTTK